MKFASNKCTYRTLKYCTVIYELHVFIINYKDCNILMYVFSASEGARDVTGIWTTEGPNLLIQVPLTIIGDSWRWETGREESWGSGAGLEDNMPGL